MLKKFVSILLALAVAMAMFTGCGNSDSSDAKDTTITVFAANSLSDVMEEIISSYNEVNPDVTFQTNYDSSGTLMTQIAEGGAACDIFFSAAEKQVNTLDEAGFLIEGTRTNLLNNQMCVVTYPGSNTKVTGLHDMDKASSLAIADGTVPIGDYTRRALIHEGILTASDDTSAITSAQLSQALGGVEINNCANVGAVVAAVSEHSNEVGTVYLSDTFGVESDLEILETVSNEISGDIIYPVAQVINEEADDAQIAATKDFLEYLMSDEAKAIFEKYHFIVIE